MSQSNKDKIQENLEHSLMLRTILNDYMGDENAAKVAKYSVKKIYRFVKWYYN